ncbi:hypothetical protein K7432_000836 [Basidiobolus ranarum]|uniref:Zn(2)-C6 fungal-type domain-containing protein n=1 Tax=Basidiobolus ranarum TaxID=34480 RepID=A0ABR2X3Z5_9FUNG
MNTDDNHKRQRVSRACDNCRRKKIRCDGEQPICSNCQSFGTQCTYNDTKKKRGPPKGYIEAIESRLHRMEHILGGLVQSDPRAAETVMFEMRRLEEEANIAIQAHPKVKPLEFREYRVPNAQIPDTPPSSNSPITTTFEVETQGATKSPRDLLVSNVISSSELNHSAQTPSNIPIDADVEALSKNTDQLILDDDGRVRHCGESSGFYLLQGSQKHQHDLFRIRPRARAYTNDNGLNLDPTVLPSPNLFGYLIDIYFTKINPIFPLLHKAEFLERINQNEQETPYFLLNAVFALSAALIPSETIMSRENLDSEIFFKKTRTLLDQAYEISSIENVQALVLMSIYFHLSRGGMKSWMYSGMAIRMAEDLGLHRNPDIWNIKLTRAEKETRKRVWWVCYLIDRFSSVCVGRPVSIDDQQFDTPLPCLSEDDLKVPADVAPSTGLSLKPFIELIGLHELIGQILSTMYIVKVPLTSNYPKFLSKLTDLDSALNLWLNSLSPELRYIPADYCAGKLPNSPTLIYAHVWYHCALILLHRPFILRPESSSTSQPSSSQICMDAANSITAIVTSCVNSPGYTESVIFLLFPIFTASTIHLLQAISPNHYIATSSRTSLFKNLDILKQIRERCGYAGRYYTVLTDLIIESKIDIEPGVIEDASLIDIVKNLPNSSPLMGQSLLTSIQSNQYLVDALPRAQSVESVSSISRVSPNMMTDFPAMANYVEGGFKVIEEQPSSNFDVMSLDPYAASGVVSQVRMYPAGSISPFNNSLSASQPDTRQYVNENRLGADMSVSTSENERMAWNNSLAFNIDEWNDYVGQYVADAITAPLVQSGAPITTSIRNDYINPTGYPSRTMSSSQQQSTTLENISSIDAPVIPTTDVPVIPTTEYVSDAELAMAYDLICHQSNGPKW